MTLLKSNRQEVFNLQEGEVLKVTSTASANGSAYQLDQTSLSIKSLQSWSIGASVMTQIGPFSGFQKILVTCVSGNIDAQVHDGVVSVPQIVVSSAAPDNNDGRPDGTIWIQTA